MPKVTLDLPEGFADSLRDLERQYKSHQEKIAEGASVDFAEFERSAEAAVAKVEREMLRGLLQSLDIDAPLVVVGGKPFAKVGRYEAPYHTKAGSVTIERSIYREVGKRNAKTVDPVSLRASVVEDGWLPETAKAMAFLIQGGTSREAEATAKQVGRMPYSRSSFERVGHAVARRYGEQREQVDSALIDKLIVPDDVHSVSVSIDRAALPIEVPRSRPVGRPKKGAAKRPVERIWRMAYCATVTLHDSTGRALHTIRYGRMPKNDARELCARLAGDLRGVLAVRPDIKVVLLSDGAVEMCELLDHTAKVAGVDAKLHRLVDFWHVIEKLGKAAVVIHGEEAAKPVVSRWSSLLLNSESARGRILNELHASGREHVRVGNEEPVHQALTYLYNQGDRMDYARARRLGLPVGSGNVEATCKSLIGLRMKRPGARWKDDSGQHILDLRALALSDRWTSAMAITLPPNQTMVRRAARSA